jgi:hypothetical protein
MCAWYAGAVLISVLNKNFEQQCPYYNTGLFVQWLCQEQAQWSSQYNQSSQIAFDL